MKKKTSKTSKKEPKIVEPELEPDEAPEETPVETPIEEVVETPQNEVIEQPVEKQSITYNGKVATRLNTGDTDTEYHCSLSDGTTQHINKCFFK